MRPDNRPESHYAWLERNFNTITERMGLEPFGGNFTSNGDKYYQYRDTCEKHGIPWYHVAAMYSLMDFYYYGEVRQTNLGWVHPIVWIVENYRSGRNLSQYMSDL